MKILAGAFTCLLLAGCGEQQLQVQTNGISGSCKANALPGVTVILHKPDGSILQQHQTGADGKLDVAWPDEARHLTLAYLDNKQSAQLHTIVDFTGGQAGIFDFTLSGPPETSTQTDCGCKSIQLNSSDLQTTMPEYQLFAGKSLSQPLATVQVCQDTAGQYPALELILAPRTTVQGLGYVLNTQSVANNGLIDLKMSDFSLRADPLSIQSNPVVNSMQSFGLSDTGRQHFMMQANGKTGQQLQLFTSQYPAQRISLYRQKTLTSAEQQMSYQQRYDIAITTTGSTPAVTLPQQESTLVAQASKLAQGWQFIAVPVELAALGQYSRLQLTAKGQNANGQAAQWRLTAPLNSTLPRLQLPSAFSSAWSVVQPSLTLSVQGYANSWDEKQLRNELIALQNGKTTAKDRRFATYREESITFKGN